MFPPHADRNNHPPTTTSNDILLTFGTVLLKDEWHDSFACKPDVVLIHKERGCVIDVAVVSSTANMVMGFNAKLEKCEILRRRLQKAKSLKSCETIPVVVTDKGLLHKTTEERLGRIVRVEWKVIRDLQIKAAQLVTRCLVACT